MKTIATLAAVPLLLFAAVSASASTRDSHQHPATTDTQAATVRRWDTDAPLRAGMAHIRVAVDALEHHEHGHMRPAPVQVLATQIEQQIAYLIVNCKLEPQADAALHVIISELAVGAQALKANPASRSVIPSMRHALQRYSVQFNDPGLAALNEPEEKR
jgi:hypothetical protein